jgi:hypothetical protein
MPWMYAVPKLKKCARCGKEFSTKSAMKRFCYDCRKEKVPQNRCVYCGRSTDGKAKVCSFCKPKEKGNGKTKGNMESKLELATDGKCPECGIEMVPTERYGHRIFECKNQKCSIIRVRVRKNNVVAITRDCAMSREEVLVTT